MSLEQTITADTGLMVDRTVDSVIAADLPAGLAVVSADNHIEVTEDIFYEAFPRACAIRRHASGSRAIGASAIRVRCKPIPRASTSTAR